MLSGVGPIIAKSVVSFFKNKENSKVVNSLLKEVKIQKEKENKSNVFGDKKFVVTGTLSGLSRDDAKELIRQNGGIISESVSKETDFLVCGENPGSKLEKAREMGVKILNEKEFLSML